MKYIIQKGSQHDESFEINNSSTVSFDAEHYYANEIKSN